MTRLQRWTPLSKAVLAWLFISTVLLSATLYWTSQKIDSHDLCTAENHRWAVLRTKLIENIQKSPTETMHEYRLRRDRTLNLVDGIYNVPC